jgi:rRNA maturation RNase YbeY
VISIYIENEVADKVKINSQILKKLSSLVFVSESFNVGMVTYIFTDDNSLSSLKKKFFGLDVFTDVMAFNLEDESNELEGEVYISFDRVKDNAKAFNVDLEQEFKRVIIHGTLHLVGYEDKSSKEKNIMTKLENKYINQVPERLIKVWN